MQRDTRQRRAIRAVFERGQRPLSPEEVHRAAQAGAPTLGLATVYRNLKALVEEGWLVPVALPGAAPRYEPAGKRHHHHFRCRECDRLYEVEGCEPQVRAPRGFQIESHDVLLYGRCAACVEAGAPPRARAQRRS
jgi:Fur family ferric uptake transcriptional regulator